MPENLPPSENQDQFQADETLAAIGHMGIGSEALKSFAKDAVWSKN